MADNPSNPSTPIAPLAVLGAGFGLIGLIENLDLVAAIGLAMASGLLIASMIALTDKIIQGVVEYVTSGRKSCKSLIYKWLMPLSDMEYDAHDFTACAVLALSVVIMCINVPLALLIFLPMAFKLVVLTLLGVLIVIVVMLRLARTAYNVSHGLKDHVNDPDAHTGEK